MKVIFSEYGMSLVYIAIATSYIIALVLFAQKLNVLP